MTEQPKSRSADSVVRSDSDRSTTTKAGKNKGRLQLGLVVLVFLSPWIFAVLWKSSGRINHGTLIEPPRPLPEVVLQADAGVTGSVEDFRGKWSWVVLADSECGDACVEKLDLVRQVRIAQKKNFKRLRYTLVIVEPQSSDIKAMLPQTLLASHPDLLVRLVRRDEHGQFLDEFDIEAGDAGSPFDSIYVVDPLGNLMMMYDSQSEPRQLHRDMARLLKASHVG